MRVWPWHPQTQRQAEQGRGCGAMTARRAASLEALPGWSWSGRLREGFHTSVLEARWSQKLAALAAFVQQHGRYPVQKCADADARHLAAWVNDQRQVRAGRKQRATLSAGRAARLEALSGWSWSGRQETLGPNAAQEAHWREMMSAATVFVRRHRRYPAFATAEERKLALWLTTQRGAKQGRGGCLMTAERSRQLETLPGWRWETDGPNAAQEAHWREMMSAATVFVRRHRRYPAFATAEERKLALWLTTQRGAKQGRGGCLMTAERSRQLEALPGWRWEYRPGVRCTVSPAATKDAVPTAVVVYWEDEGIPHSTFPKTRAPQRSTHVCRGRDDEEHSI